MSTVVPNFVQIRGFLYFGCHFGFKMATIANQNGRKMVPHVLLPVNIHFHWNLFIFEFLTICFNFYICGHFENFKNKEHNFEWWSIFMSSYKRIQFGVNLTFFAPWLPCCHFEFFQPLKSCHTLRWIFLQNFMKFDERNLFFLKIHPFLFPWQLRQSLSNRFRFFRLISFH